MTGVAASLARPPHGAPFKRILCAVDGSPDSGIGLEHAIALAGQDATLTVAAVYAEGGSLERVVRDIVEGGVAVAQAAGAHVARRLVKAPTPADGLIAAMATHDLVVLGMRRHGRARGIMTGDTATAVAHRAPGAVLLARDGPLRAGVLAATDGRPETRRALTAATIIASRLGAPLTVLHVREPEEHGRRNELAAEIANARALLGRDLHYVTDVGDPAARIVAAAGEAGLVVTGSGGKHGVAALGSTSERVAHKAPCSVLIIRDR